MFQHLRNVLKPMSLLKGKIKPIKLFTLQFLLAFKCRFVFEKLFWPQNTKNPSTNPKALHWDVCPPTHPTWSQNQKMMNYWACFWLLLDLKCFSEIPGNSILSIVSFTKTNTITHLTPSYMLHFHRSKLIHPPLDDEAILVKFKPKTKPPSPRY